MPALLAGVQILSAGFGRRAGAANNCVSCLARSQGFNTLGVEGWGVVASSLKNGEKMRMMIEDGRRWKSWKDTDHISVK